MKKRMTAFLCTLALILTMIPAAAPTAEAATPSETLYVGYGLKNVTPTMSVPLAGYGETHLRMSEYNASNVTSSHLLDDNGDGVVNANDGIYAACIAVKDSSGEILIFFGMDLIGANETWVTAAREGTVEALAAKGITVKKSNISVTVSHTHSSPDMSSSNAAIATYRDTILVPGMVEAAVNAVADLKLVTDISKHTVKTENMNFVRHYAYYKDSTYTGEPIGYKGDNYTTGSTSKYVKHVGQADPNIYMLKFTREGGKPVVMANWQAHPKCNSTADTYWGNINRKKVSSDFVGTFRADLANAGYLVAFFQGAAGNINTFSLLHKVSSNTSADPTNSATKTNVSGVSKHEKYGGSTVSGNCQTGVLYGRVLANYAKEGLAATASTSTVKVESLSGGKIKAQQRMFSATIDHSDQEAYEALMQEYSAGVTYYDYIKNNWSSSVATTYKNKYDINSIYHLNAIVSRGKATSSAYDLELNAYQIGDDVAIVTAPNELFDTYCRSLRNKGIFVFGYSNNSMGYLPDRDGIEKYKCYEANTTRHVVGTGEAVATTLEEMLMTPEELGLKSTCHLCGATNVQWEVLNGLYQPNGTDWVYTEARYVTKIESGHYYMLHDMMGYSSTWQKSFYGNVCLDMRGHTIEGTSNTTGRAMLAATGSNIHIANGTVIGQGIKTSNNGTGGVLTLSQNSTVTAQNIALKRAVKDGLSVLQGGVVYMGANTTLNLQDCTVTGGVATNQAGGIYVPSTGKLNIGGNTVITGNTLADGTQNNVYLTQTTGTAGKNFKLLPGFSGSVGVALPSYAQNTVFGSCANPYTSGGFVDLDGSDSFVSYNSGKLTVGNACPYCGQTNVVWKEFPASGNGDVLNIPAGHYYLADDRTGSSNFRRQIQGDVCLNMNGHTFATESGVTGNAFYVNTGNTFNVFGGGVIQGQGYGGTSTADGLYRGGVIRVDTGATANLYGTTVQRKINGNQIAKWGGAIYAAGELNLYNATVKGGVATINGDGIYVATTGSVNLAGNTDVEKNIYVDTTGDTTGSRLSVAEGFTGTATIELPAYTDGLVFGTAGSYTGTVNLADENAMYTVSGGNMTVYVPNDVCQIVSADGTASAAYDSVEEALADYAYSTDAPSYIRLLKDVKTVATVNETVYLDTNGFDITVDVTGNGKLYGMENATNDYVVGTDDLGKITVQSGSALNVTDITLGGVRYRYLPLEQSGGVFTYHRFDMDTKKGLRPYNAAYGVALYYEPHFTANEMVSAVLNDTEASFGVMISIGKQGAEPVYVSMEDYELTFNEDVKIGKYRVAVPDLMPNNSDLEAGTKTIANHDLSSYVVTGQAYIMLNTAAGQQYFISDDPDAAISLRDAVLKVDNDAVYNNLSQTQKTALNTMYKYYSTTIKSWGSDLLTNIGSIKIDISDWFD